MYEMMESFRTILALALILALMSVVVDVVLFFMASRRKTKATLAMKITKVTAFIAVAVALFAKTIGVNVFSRIISTLALSILALFYLDQFKENDKED